eukprot:804591-Pelagomonas_calceolata.AAC.4
MGANWGRVDLTLLEDEINVGKSGEMGANLGLVGLPLLEVKDYFDLDTFKCVALLLCLLPGSNKCTLDLHSGR